MSKYKEYLITESCFIREAKKRNIPLSKDLLKFYIKHDIFRPISKGLYVTEQLLLLERINGMLFRTLGPLFLMQLSSSQIQSQAEKYQLFLKDKGLFILKNYYKKKIKDIRLLYDIKFLQEKTLKSAIRELKKYRPNGPNKAKDLKWFKKNAKVKYCRAHRSKILDKSNIKSKDLYDRAEFYFTKGFMLDPFQNSWSWLNGHLPNHVWREAKGEVRLAKDYYEAADCFLWLFNGLQTKSDKTLDDIHREVELKNIDICKQCEKIIRREKETKGKVGPKGRLCSEECARLYNTDYVAKKRKNGEYK